jgi:hypothetical protein
MNVKETSTDDLLAALMRESRIITPEEAVRLITEKGCKVTGFGKMLVVSPP